MAPTRTNLANAVKAFGRGDSAVLVFNALKYCSLYGRRLYSATEMAHQNAAFAHLTNEGNPR